MNPQKRNKDFKFRLNGKILPNLLTLARTDFKYPKKANEFYIVTHFLDDICKPFKDSTFIVPC